MMGEQVWVAVYQQACHVIRKRFRPNCWPIMEARKDAQEVRETSVQVLKNFVHFFPKILSHFLVRVLTEFYQNL